MFSPGSNLLASSASGGRIARLWDAHTSDELALLMRIAPWTSDGLGFSLDGRLLVIGGRGVK
ncbi:MAG: WD40 repeat domain-containing protein [Chloroflexi bacterium]|nr:WD40 repeat domain-containing protein [Chloroflexota bacterium]